MADATAETGTDEAYGGLPGAFPYAIRASDSRLFRLYVVLAVLLSLLVTVLFVIGLVGVLSETAGARGGTFTFSRTFFLAVGVIVVAPLLAPVLLVARRHRRRGSSVGYDRALALAGLGFVASLYLGLYLSQPDQLTDSPLVRSVPQTTGLAPPAVAVALMYAVHRLLR